MPTNSTLAEASAVADPAHTARLDVADAPVDVADGTEPAVLDARVDPPGVTQLDVADALSALLRDTGTEPRPDSQLEALTLAVAADLPVLLWGEPGIGKTAALTQLAETLDLPLTTVIASVHEPSDFSGLPVLGDDPAEQGVPMAPPDWAVRLVRGQAAACCSWTNCPPRPRQFRPPCSVSSWNGASDPFNCRPG